MRTKGFIKLTLAVLFTLSCVAFALVPEGAMYFSWHLIAPQTEFAKIVVLGLFWICGAGLCFVFAMLSMIVWAAGLQEIL